MLGLQVDMADTDAAPDAANTLAEHWLRDQSIAFAATLLGKLDPFFEARGYACGTLLAENVETIRTGFVSDSTLSLVSTIDPEYLCEECLAGNELRRLASVSAPLAQTVAAARGMLDKRDAISAGGLNRVLVSHSVYVLKRPQISATKFLKWIHRAAPDAVPGMPRILAELQRPGSELGALVDAALAESKNPDKQTRDRLDQIDLLHDMVLQAAGDQHDKVEVWWMRICMAYRSSLFCWPLLTEGEPGEPDRNGGTGHGPSERGLSLPISLFVIEDGKSTWQPAPNPNGQKIWFKYKLSRAEEKTRKAPRFREIRDGLPAHMNGFRFGFTWEWWQAFAIGVDVAKKLWSSQNGRLRLADAQAADRKRMASLNVDLRATCDIVESVYSRVPEDDWHGLSEEKRFFVVKDRSAEAYWVQCVLGLLLPAREVPLGLCTGTIEYLQGEFEMGDVTGIVAKLEYANRAGVPRVVVPGDRREFYDEDDKGDEDGDGHGDATEIGPDEGAEAGGDGDAISKLAGDSRAELKAFEQSRKTLEVNRARTARAAADAMQPSGWRRANFLRTHDFQRSFGWNQRRLFIRDSLQDPRLARHLKRSEIAWYNRQKRWFDIETAQLEQLDQILLSGADRSVKYVEGNRLIGRVPNSSIEQTLAKWAAWKDNQVRTGEGVGYRGPGLGVLTLRTAEGDHELRLWAALAELLDADDEWWERFQWSDLPRSADLLAQLLCNQRADPQISLGSAPDLLIIFDDAGMTQRRSNVIFPKDFHHQFFDLLNPRHPANHKRDHLDEALKRHGQSALGHPTRIIVVIDGEEPLQADDDAPLAPEERDILGRLAIFRFGCSRQAGFAMANFDREQHARLSWEEFERSVGRLIKSRLLTGSRNALQVTRKARERLGNNTPDDPLRLAFAHRQAALAMCPILHPRGLRISTNRDRQLEPESVLEADWHLNRAFSLVPWRFQSRWHTGDGMPSVAESQALLTFLRTSPDWDTVIRLRVNSKTRRESVELCHDLFRMRRAQTGLEPSSTTVGLAIETMGRVFKNEDQKQDTIEPQAEEIVAMVDDALATLKTEDLTKTEWQRRLRHLFSRQVFALRMLGLPLTDARLAGAKSYIDNAIGEILGRDFLAGVGEGREGLDDFPISKDCWRALWSDGNGDKAPNKTLTLAERSTYAYAAARANLGKTRAGQPPTEPWDEPWMAYFTLTHPESIAPSQVVAPLNTWWDVYGQTLEASRSFGQAVLNMQPHAQQARKGRRDWTERWSRNVVEASSNLWSYVTHPDPEHRLIRAPVAPALRLINVLALQETLPAFGFLNACGRDWLGHWPSLSLVGPGRWPDPALDSCGFVADEWTALGRSVVGNMAGWVTMLADLETLPDDEARLYRVWGWLKAYDKAGAPTLMPTDPEDLLHRANGMKSVVAYKSALNRAQKAAGHILSLRSDRGWKLYGHHRGILFVINGTLKD